jgi:pyridoxal phosphate-dependent aminotransferase EpsN
MEREYIEEAIKTNWVAPVGPHIDAFEKEVARYISSRFAVALSSGTAAIHLALIVEGVGRGDTVYCSTFTFSASANPIVYQGGTPLFIDADAQTWNMDPHLLDEELKKAAHAGSLPRALIVAHLYGQSADMDPIMDSCSRYGVTVIEDAAESLGSTYKGKQTGTLGKMGILSFNGNKIITTSGGGMLLTDDEKIAARVRHLSTQARENVPYYLHKDIGYNYRMSNVLAGIGRGQLQVLDERVGQRRRVNERYRDLLGEVEGISFMPQAAYGRSNCWLTCVLIDPDGFGATREEVRLNLESRNIESRPLWLPLHLQPVFSGCPRAGGEVSEGLFDRGLCLPSGSALTDNDLDLIVGTFLETAAR